MDAEMLEADVAVVVAEHAVHVEEHAVHPSSLAPRLPLTQSASVRPSNVVTRGTSW